MARWKAIFPDAKRTKADYLLDGHQAFDSILAAIDTARKPGHYVYILGWMIDADLMLIPGNAGSTLSQRLRNLPNKVEVRILVWDNLLSGEHLKTAETAVKRFSQNENIKIFVENTTFYPKASKEILKYFQAAARLLLPVLRKFLNKQQLATVKAGLERDGIGSHHEKVTIVKGEEGLIAFCGGIDYNPDRLHHKDGKISRLFPSVHDTMCRLQGPAAHQVLEKFCLRWKNHPPASAIALAGETESVPQEVSREGHHALVVGTFNAPSGGQPKIRTFREAYLRILDAAETYVYIEDQYLTNLDVADHLRPKLSQPGFEKIILVCQASDETRDFLIPNRKRDEFMSRLLAGSTDDQRKKVLRAVVDKRFWRQEQYHPGMHAKTLIVDDSLAIIGSGNVNRRSFTCDSETSVIVFDDEMPSNGTFAARFRAATWEEYLIRGRRGGFDRDWRPFVTALETDSLALAKITRYVEHNAADIDDLAHKMLLASGAATFIVNRVLSQPVAIAAKALGGARSPEGLKLKLLEGGIHVATIGGGLIESILLVKARALIDIVWEHVIDPDGDRP